MKKHLILAICFLAAVFFASTGCDHDGLGGPSDGGSIGLSISQNQLDPTRLAGAQVTFERAIEIAIAHSGSGIVKEIELERKRGGLLVYEVEIINNQRKHEIQINAITGAIIRSKEERSSSSYIYNDSFVSQITSANAVRLSEIGLAQVGGGTIVEMIWELSWNGQYIFEIEIRDTRGRKHEIKIDPATGTIIRIESKR